MWLDRFSNSSTPNSTTPNRYHSPGPRKPSLLAQYDRNGLGIGIKRPESSTSNENGAVYTSSNGPRPLLQRQLTGSSLRQETTQSVVAEHPAEVLQRIIGFNHEQADARKVNSAGPNADEDAVDLDDVDFEGLDLDAFVDHIEKRDSGQVAAHPQTSPSDKPKFDVFHASIADADHVLASVQTYLTSFKAELGQVSAEIESLQSRSMQLNAQLDNRRGVEKLLGPAVEEISLSPATVRAIADGPIDDTFAKALTEIEARHLAVTERLQGDGSAKAAEDVKPLLDDLKTRAVERIRDYFVSHIKAMRSPNTNSQVMQQQSFLKHKELYPFLARVNPRLADDIGKAYSNTMRWYFQSNFTRYNSALSKMQIHAIDQTDLLGSDPATRKQNVTGSSKNTFSQRDAFNLGRRGDYLKSKDDRALPSHLAEDSKMTAYLEVPFRNFNQALLDNLSCEYSAVTELFSTSTFHQVSRRVSDMFEPVFSMGHQLTKHLVENTTDCLGILICIRLNQQYAFEAQKRKIPVMDDYINYTNILLWPRFQKAMDMHIESLKKVPSVASRGASAAFSLVGGTASTASTVAPHAVTQRFGQFIHGILTLSVAAGDDEPLAHSLARLRGEYETLMGKLAKGAGDASKRARFLFNNYSLVLTIISDTEGKLAEEQKEYFGTLVRDLKPR